jgi:hypothetical protein
LFSDINQNDSVVGFVGPQWSWLLSRNGLVPPPQDCGQVVSPGWYGFPDWVCICASLHSRREPNIFLLVDRFADVSVPAVPNLLFGVDH